MRKLLLYPKGLPTAAANAAEPEQRDLACARCVLHENVRYVCMAPEGQAGGVLVIGEKPSRLEDTAGKVFYGQYGLQFRRMLEKHWRGATRYDYAIRCATGAKKISDKQIAACRVYTAAALEQSPQRILCLGSEAALSVLGRRVSAQVVRKAYGWAKNADGDPIPVYTLPNPAIAFRNPFSTRAFEEDLQWALAASHTPWFKDVYTVLVETEDHARVAASSLSKHQWYAYDVETTDLMHDKAFRIETVTLLGDTATRSFTWTKEAMQDKGVREILATLFRSPKLATVTQNGKYDDRAVMLDLGAEIPNIMYDTRLGRKLLDPEADARLSTIAETVGMGGHKLEAKAALSAIKKELNRQANPLPEFTPKGKRRKTAPPKFSVPTEVLTKIRAGHDTEAFAYGFMDHRTLYRYNARDVWSTREVAHDQMPRLFDHPTISRAWNLVVKDANKAVRYIEHWGFPVDKAAVQNLAAYCDQRIGETQAQMRQYTDINPASPKQLAKYLFEDLGLRSVKETDSGAQSTDEDALETLRGEHPYVNHLLEFRKLSKFSGTYAHGLLRHIRDDGRVHPSFLIDGAGTGRLSCVASWTMCRTDRGVLPMAEVRVGDNVWTHKNRWRRVLATIDQGSCLTYDLKMSNGNVLTCTPSHRLLREDGAWVTVAEVIDVGVKGVGWQYTEPEGSSACLSRLARVDDGRTDRRGRRHDVSQRAPRSEPLLTGRGIPATEGRSVLSIENKLAQPYVRQDRRSAPQLERCVRGRLRLSDLPLGRQAGVSAQPQSGGSARAEVGPEGLCCPPYRRGPNEQLDRQPSVMYGSGAQADSRTADQRTGFITIEEIHYRGNLEVFDLTIDEDESYETEGIFSHNCRDPNLQNIPRAKGSVLGKMARDCFIASSPSHVLIEADFSQLELRIAAMLAGDDVMIADFKNGIDIHTNGATLCCEAAWKLPRAKWDKMTKDERDPYRSQIKTVIFGRLYGKTDKGIAREFGVSVGTIVQINKMIWGRYKKLERFMQACVTESRRTGEAWTWWDGGRARVRPIWRILDQDQAMRAHYERTAGNTSVQGTAAEFATASLSPIVEWLVGDAVPGQLVCTVHDSIMLNVHRSAAYEARYQLKRIMLSHNSNGVPLGVDVKWGPSWGSLTDMSEEKE